MRVLYLGIFVLLTYFSAFADIEVIPVDKISPGQHYSDYIYCRKKIFYKDEFVIMNQEYDVIQLDEFIEKVKSEYYPKMEYFLYEYIKFSDLKNVPFDTSARKTMAMLVSNQVPVFVSCNSDHKILNLFPNESKTRPMVYGIVDVNLTQVYDLTGREDFYKNSTLWKWDGKTYRTFWETLVVPMYSELEDRGNKMFYEDVKYGKQTLVEKMSIVVTPTVAPKTNVVVISEINSKISLSGPQYGVEGDVLTYHVNRQGVNSYALTVHVLVNGLFHTNISWKASESGTRVFMVSTKIDDEFNDNKPIEVTLKTLQRNIQ